MGSAKPLSLPVPPDVRRAPCASAIANPVCLQAPIPVRLWSSENAKSRAAAALCNWDPVVDPGRLRRPPDSIRRRVSDGTKGYARPVDLQRDRKRLAKSIRRHAEGPDSRSTFSSAYTFGDQRRRKAGFRSAAVASKPERPNFLESEDGEGLDNWFGLLRNIEPAQTQQGIILFDVALTSYRLRITDGGEPGADRFAWCRFRCGSTPTTA